MHGDWQDAISRLEAVYAWRTRRGRSDGPAARFDFAQIAYARCRLDPNADTRAQLDQALSRNQGWTGWAAWLAHDLRAACASAALR